MTNSKKNHENKSSDDQSDDQSDDLLTMLGLTEIGKPFSSEEMFYFYLTQGEGSRLDNITYQLTHAISIFLFLKSRGLNITVNKFDGAVARQTPVSNQEYIQHMLEYYLYMYHLTRFTHSSVLDGQTYAPCDMATIVSMLMDHPDVKKIIAKKSE